MIPVWVIGNNGLLGQALCRMLIRQGCMLYIPLERFDWSSGCAVLHQFKSAVTAFSAFVAGEDAWEIYWAAGVGNMSSLAVDLAQEKRALAFLLDLVKSDLRLMGKNGRMAFASSAGSIYAGSHDFHINENSLPVPTSEYAYEKIIQENMVCSFINSNTCMMGLIARFSTLYGNNQSIGKQQGLLSHIARSILRDRPIQIFVPLDTIRDYIDVDDAATMMICSLRAIKKPGAGIKIIASEQPATIASIIAKFKSITRHSPRIVTSIKKFSVSYPLRMQFRSVVFEEYSHTPKKNLLIGIAQIMEAEKVRLKKSRFSFEE